MNCNCELEDIFHQTYRDQTDKQFKCNEIDEMLRPNKITQRYL
jgi:hypothetical protein